MQASKRLSCPDTIRVFGRTYTVAREFSGNLGQVAIGLTDNMAQTITVDGGLTPIEEVDTVVHELFHAVLYTMKVGLDRDTEEKVVSALATGLVGVLQDNQELAEWIIAPRGDIPEFA